MASPKLRAACLGMLCIVAMQDFSIIAQQWDRVLTLAQDEWWEVRAQLCILCATALQRCAETETDTLSEDHIAQTMEITRYFLDPSQQCAAVLSISTAYVAQTLDSQPDLIVPFIDAVISLPNEPRERSLDVRSPPHELPFTGSSGLRYRLPHLPLWWPATEVASTLVESIFSNDLQHLETGHYQIIEALVRPESYAEARRVRLDAEEAPVDTDVASVPEDVLVEIRKITDHVLVGICNPDSCHQAVEVLRMLILGIEAPFAEEMLRSSTLQGALLLLVQHPSGAEPDEETIGAVANLLTEVSDYLLVIF